MSSEEVQGIALLVLVSLIVRIIPALIPLPAFLGKQEQLEKIAPIAVLLNLGVFCALSEIDAQPLPALGGLMVMAVLFFFFHQRNILLLLGIASLAFFTIAMIV